MQKIIDQKHTKYTFIYGLATLFERAGYYGLRTVLVLYLTSSLLSEGGLEMSREDALGIYGTFAMAIALTQILGGVLGDLVLKNKNAIILGATLQAVGAFILCFHAVSAVYIGIGLIALGTGFYKPNMTAHFGKLYLNKTKLLDGAYTIYYAFINIGAFIGALVLGYIGEVYSWKLAFIVSGVFFLVSALFLLFSKEDKVENVSVNQKPLRLRMSIISIVLVSLGLFWLFYDLAYRAVINVEVSLMEVVDFNTPYFALQLIESFPGLILTIIFGIIWTWYYNHQFMKMLIGFIFGGLSFGVLFLIPEVVTAQHFWLFCVSLLFLSVAEIHLTPVLSSTIVKYVKLKYLATAFALSTIFTQAFVGLTKFFPDEFYTDPSNALKVGFIGMLVMIIILVIGMRFGKKILKSNAQTQNI